MTSGLILAMGLLPAFGLVSWETARQRRQRRQQFLAPVSPEAVRWAQYVGAAYAIGYAGVALAYIDGLRAPAPLLLGIVLCTCLTSGLLLWYVGQRYGAPLPRLTDMREQSYRSRVALQERGHLLSRQAFHAGAERFALRADIARSEAMLTRCDQHLRQLQLALTTEAFVRRVRYPEAGRQELRELAEEQRRLLADTHAFLLATAPLERGLQPAYELAAG